MIVIIIRLSRVSQPSDARLAITREDAGTLTGPVLDATPTTV
jgi:hypothetical protein